MTKKNFIGIAILFCILGLVFVKNFTSIAGVENVSNFILWIFTILMLVGSFRKNRESNKNSLSVKIIGRCLYFGTAFSLIYFDDILMGSILVFSCFVIIAVDLEVNDKRKDTKSKEDYE